MVLDRRLTPLNAAANSLLSPQAQISSELDLNVSLAAADSAVVLGVGYPMGYNESTAKHAPWMAPDPTVLAIFLGSTPATGGNFDITVNDHIFADIAFDVTAAALVAIFKAGGYDVSVVLASDTYTITFDAETEIKVLPTVTGDVTDLTGDTASSSTTTAGTSTFGTHNIRGFVNPEDSQIGTETGAITLSRVTTTATATTVNPHGLVTGMSLTMSGATNAAFNVTATITVTGTRTYTYTVADSGTTTDSGVYTTTNETMVLIMTKGTISASLPQSLVATGDVTALNTALKNDLVEKNLIVQGLAGRF